MINISLAQSFSLVGKTNHHNVLILDGSIQETLNLDFVLVGTCQNSIYDISLEMTNVVGFVPVTPNLIVDFLRLVAT